MRLRQSREGIRNLLRQFKGIPEAVRGNPRFIILGDHSNIFGSSHFTICKMSQSVLGRRTKILSEKSWIEFPIRKVGEIIGNSQSTKICKYKSSYKKTGTREKKGTDVKRKIFFRSGKVKETLNPKIWKIHQRLSKKWVGRQTRTNHIMIPV